MTWQKDLFLTAQINPDLCRAPVLVVLGCLQNTAAAVAVDTAARPLASDPTRRACISSYRERGQVARALTMHAHCSSTHVMTKLTSIGCFAYHRATICGRDGAKRFDGVLRERERERERREREDTDRHRRCRSYCCDLITARVKRLERLVLIE